MDELTDAERQLCMARFAMHRVRITVYASQMMAGNLSEEQAREEYRKAMENYDQILALAVTEPERIKACVEDMERGFDIRGNSNND